MGMSSNYLLFVGLVSPTIAKKEITLSVVRLRSRDQLSYHPSGTVTHYDTGR